MARKWAKQEIDLRILEALYVHKNLRGKVLTMIGGEGEKRGYERIGALVKQGFVLGETLVKRVSIGNMREKEYMNRKVAVIYYLTARGQVTVKEEILNKEPNGAERARKPSEEQMMMAYQLSLLLESLMDLYDGFEPVADYKRKHNLVNYLPILLAHPNAIFLNDVEAASDRKDMLLQCQAISERIGLPKIIILSTGKRKHYELLRYWKENYGQNERIMYKGNIYGIRHLVTDGYIFKNYFKSQGMEFAKLPRQYEGCNYRIGNEYSNFYDLVGLPAKELRKVKKAEGLIYLGISDESEIKLLNRLYPELGKKQIEYLVIENLLGRFSMDEEIAEVTAISAQDKWKKVMESIKGEQVGER